MTKENRRMYYTIETHGNTREVHYIGYMVDGYPDGIKDDGSWTDGDTKAVGVTGIYLTPSEAAAITPEKLDLLEVAVTQYPSDLLTDEEAEEYAFEYFFCGDHGEYLHLHDVTEDTPCGMYWCEGWWTWGE